MSNIAILGMQSSLGRWDPDSIIKGIGGSEEAIIYAAEVLTYKGYRVVVFADPPSGSRWGRSSTVLDHKLYI